jgi:uncharacterized protein (TIGR00251 family)
VNPIRPVSGGVRLTVRVIPRARTTALAGVRDDALLVRLAAPPVDEAANRDLVAFLAAALGVPVRTVRIVSGDRSRRKVVEIGGVSEERCRGALGL